MKNIGFAFDRSATARAYDADERLHVSETNISKAAVNPYFGREIPGYVELGLDGEKIYQLLRCPDELAKAVATFNNLPILSQHVPVTARDHRPKLVIGSTGTNAKFDGGYLKNSAVFWSQDFIDKIEDETQKELSSAYRYRPDMTPGEWQGLHYDGVMRDIVGNHVALVDEGRAGPDVVVADRKPEMLKSRRAIMLHGALAAYVAPKLAQDSAIDLTGVLSDVNAGNLAKRRKGLADAIVRLVEPKLAQDEGIDAETLCKVIDAVTAEEIAEDEDDIPEAAKEDADEAEDESDREAEIAGLMDYLKDRLSPEDYEHAASMVRSEAAMDQDTTDGDDGEVDKVTKANGPAMDHKTVAKMIAAAEARGAKLAQDSAFELRKAEAAVAPLIGRLANPPKDAASVYHLALDHAGVPKAAYSGMALDGLAALVAREAGAKKRAPVIAQDRSTSGQAAKLFPKARIPTGA